MGWIRFRGCAGVARAVLALALATSVLGCEGSILGLDSDGAQSVRISLADEEGDPGEVTYLVSSNFRVTLTERNRLRLDLNEADTVTTALPIDNSFSTGPEPGQLVFVVIDRTAAPGRLAMRVWLDDELRTQTVFEEGDEVKTLYLFQTGVSVEDFTVL